MKRFFPILCFLFLLSCQKPEQNPVDYFKLSERTVQAGSLAGTYTVTLCTDQPWRVVNTSEWCKVLPESGNAALEPGDELYVIVRENLGLDARSCQVTVQAGEQQLQLEIVQAHRDGVLLQQKSCTLTASAQQYAFKFPTSGNFTAEVDAGDRDWLSCAATKAMHQGGLVVTVTENPSYTRRGHLTLKTPAGDERIEVVQSGTVIRFDDPVFEQYCMEWDTDRDGVLSVEEAQQVRSILIAKDVRSVAGLEYFTRVERLQCAAQLDVLDLNALTELRSLGVWSPVKELRIDQNAHLADLNLYQLQQDALVLSDKPELEWFYLSESPVHTVRVCNCPALSTLRFSFLSELDEVELDGNERLMDFSSLYSPMSRLTMDRCPNLTWMTLNSTRLTSLDVSGLSKLQRLDCSGNTLLEKIYLSKLRHQSLNINYDAGAELVYL